MVVDGAFSHKINYGMIFWEILNPKGHLNHITGSKVTAICLKVQSRDFFFFHNKFAFGQYIQVHSVVLKVWFVKCSQITMFTLKITPKSNKNVHAMGNQSNKETNAIGIQSNKKTHALYLEQQKNQC